MPDEYSEDYNNLKQTFSTKEIEDEFGVHLEEELSEDFSYLIEEMREDPEYIRLKNMPLDLVKNTKEFNFKMYHDIREYNKIYPDKPTVILSNEDKQREVLRCKYDILYFARNYAIVSTVAGDFEYETSESIESYLRLFEASVQVLFMTSRQSSKTFSSMVGTVWYFSFWSMSQLTLVNTLVAENKKNIRTTIDVMDKMPDFMQVMKGDNKNILDNVFEKRSAIKSYMSGGVVNRMEPESSLRGKTSALLIDEVAYLNNIEVAYSAMAFIYSTYSVMSKRTHTPAPFSLTSTPADLTSLSGEFWHDMWQEASVIDYNEIKDLLPFEIKDYLLKRGITSAKVEQFWFQYPSRAKRKDVYDKEFLDKYQFILMDPNTRNEDILEIDEGLYDWLITTKAISKTVKNIKKDIYCLFLASQDNAIFDEEIIDSLLRSKRTPIKVVDVSTEYVKKAKLKFYKKIEPVDLTYRYFGQFDIASASRGGGDYIALTILDVHTFELVATARFRTSKVIKIHETIKKIIEVFNGEMAFSIERNSMGVAVIEECEEDPYLKSRMMFTYYIARYGKDKNIEKKEYGLTTTSVNRPIMISLFLDYVQNNHRTMKDSELIDEICTLVDVNGKIQSSLGKHKHDDLVLSLASTLYILTDLSEYVSKVSQTVFKDELNGVRIHDMNDPDNEDQHITTASELKELKSSVPYKYYEEEFENMREDGKKKVNVGNLFANFNL